MLILKLIKPQESIYDSLRRSKRNSQKWRNRNPLMCNEWFFIFSARTQSRHNPPNRVNRRITTIRVALQKKTSSHGNKNHLIMVENPTFDRLQRLRSSGGVSASRRCAGLSGVECLSISTFCSNASWGWGRPAPTWSDRPKPIVLTMERDWSALARAGSSTCRWKLLLLIVNVMFQV